MKFQRVVTVVLSLFVLISLGYLIEDNRRNARIEKAEVELAAGGRMTVVYYFHGTKRCHTCRTIEAYTREAIESTYGEELAAGKVEVRAVNVDEAANAHFVEDYDLAMRSVVLVEIIEGRQKRWKRLDEVWQLVDDKDAFVDYIVDNADGFIRKRG